MKSGAAGYLLSNCYMLSAGDTENEQDEQNFFAHGICS